MTNVFTMLDCTLVLTAGFEVANDCRNHGIPHARDASHPSMIIDASNRVLPEIAAFERFVILINEGEEDIRDSIAGFLGDERCGWAYIPDEPENLPVVVAGAQRMWIDEVSRLSDIPNPGPTRTYETGFEGLDRHGLHVVTPAFMSIVGPYSSGKSIFLRQLLVNLWRLHGWKFLLTSFEEQVRPRFERDLMRHMLGTVEPSWSERDKLRAREEINEACVFMRRKRNTVLDVDRLINRLEFAIRVYGVRVIAIDPWNEVDHAIPKGVAKTDYVGTAIMRLKQLADDYNVLVIVALHPPKDGVEKRLQKNSLLTLNDGADSAHWGNKSDIGFCMWRPHDGPSLLHIDKLKDHETMGRPTLCEMLHNPDLNRFEVGRIGYDIVFGDEQ